MTKIKKEKPEPTTHTYCLMEIIGGVFTISIKVKVPYAPREVKCRMGLGPSPEKNLDFCVLKMISLDAF